MFENNTFDADKWSAPEEIKKCISGFHLVGRKIECMRFVGLCYDCRQNDIEEAAYNQLEHLPEEECLFKSEYDHIDPCLLLSRSCEIDEPFLIRFDDGDVFEIATPQEPVFSMSMNCIPWDIEAGINCPNVNANVMFSPCLGQAIKMVEVERYTTDKDPMSHEPFDEENSTRELVLMWYCGLKMVLGYGLGLGLIFAV